MKQRLACATVVACTALVGTAAYAQSSVTLYGVLDLELQFAKSGATKLTRLQDEGWQQSRLGLRGTEDLGGGWKTLFTLEGGLLADSGQGSGTGGAWNFNRQAYLALESSQWGRVSAGRMYTPMFIAVHAADPLGINPVYSSAMLVYATDAQPDLRAFVTRGNNMLRWRSPTEAAWYVDVAYGFSELPAPHRSNGRLTSGAFGYKQKPYTLLYSFQKVVQGSSSAPVDNPNTTHNQAISAAWNVNPNVRLMAAYVLNKVERNATAVGDAKIGMLGADWKLGAHTLIATAARRTVEDSPRKQTTWTLGWDYSLSKRTILYARYRHLDNAAHASVSISRVPIVADSGDDVQALGFGMRHSF